MSLRGLFNRYLPFFVVFTLSTKCGRHLSPGAHPTRHDAQKDLQVSSMFMQGSKVHIRLPRFFGGICDMVPQGDAYEIRAADVRLSIYRFAFAKHGWRADGVPPAERNNPKA